MSLGTKRNVSIALAAATTTAATAGHHPNILAIIETLATILGNAAIIAAFVVAVRHLRTLHIDRTAHIVVAISRHLQDMDDHLMVLSDRYAKKIPIDVKKFDDPATISFRLVGNLFDLMAALVAKNVFDIEILDAAFGLTQFKVFYQRFTNEINILQKEDPERYKWIVLLATDPKWQERIGELSKNH